MAQDRTRKIVITAVLGGITILLGLTHWGFIPWFGGLSLTIMHVPVIIGAILEGPIVGLGIGEYGVMALIIILLTVVGMFLDGISIFLIFVPLLMPIATAFGWDETVFRDLNRTAAKAAFCDAATRDAILKRLEPENA